MSDLVGNQKDRFSRHAADIKGVHVSSPRKGREGKCSKQARMEIHPRLFICHLLYLLF